MGKANKKAPVKKNKTGYIIAASILAVIMIIGFVVFTPGNGGTQAVQSTPLASGVNTDSTQSKAASADGSGIVIDKSKITDKATFFPYQSGNVKMEVLAVKAPDGTIRTAFNTCQVCFDSGRGYYVQEGDELVCQNCGNRFAISKVEKIKNGCNPVPIVSENKTENDSTITIFNKFMDANKELFADWKR